MIGGRQPHSKYLGGIYICVSDVYVDAYISTYGISLTFSVFKKKTKATKLLNPEDQREGDKKTWYYDYSRRSVGSLPNHL